jgi:hypothetical protein
MAVSGAGWSDGVMERMAVAPLMLVLEICRPEDEVERSNTPTLQHSIRLAGFDHEFALTAGC